MTARIGLGACLVLPVVVLTGPALFGNASLGPDRWLDADPFYASGPVPDLPWMNDLTRVHVDLPRDLAFARALHQGRLDLWNPRAACGAPLWAEQGGPFFPLKLPFYLWPSRRTYDLFAALRLLAAGVGAYLLARARGVGGVPALAAGVLFEVSGAMMSQVPFGAASATCLLPWVVLGAEAVAVRRSLAAAAAAAIALGLAASGGHPTLTIVVFAGFAAAIFTHVVTRWRSPAAMLRVTALAVLAGMFGVLLAAPTLLPFVELATVGSSYKLTARVDFISKMASREYWSVLPITLFAPSAIEPMRSTLAAVVPEVIAPVVGVFALTLAVTGVMGRRPDAAVIGLVLVGVGLVFPEGPLGPVTAVPPLRWVLPRYAWPLIALALTQTAGDGVRTLGTSGGRKRFAAAVGIITLAASSLALVSDPKRPLPLDPALGTALRAALHGSGLVRVVLPFVVAIGLAGAGLSRRASGWRRGWVGTLVVAAVLEALATMAPHAIQPASTVLEGPAPPAVRFLADRLREPADRFTGARLAYPMSAALFGLHDLRGMFGMPIARYVDYLSLVASSPEISVITTGKHVRSPLLDLAAARFIAVPRSAAAELVPADDRHVAVYTDDRVAIFENPGALPRARIVHDAVVVDGPVAARAWLQTTARAQLASRAVVERDALGREPPALDGGAVDDGETVRIVDETDPDRLVLEARLARPGLVLVADTVYPGWEAAVDERATSIFPANGLFRAVAVPAGPHRIVFRYRPRSLRAGVVGFALAAAACGYVILRRRADDTRG